MTSSSPQNSDEHSGLLRTLWAAFWGVLFGFFLSKLNTPTEDDSEPVHPQNNSRPETTLPPLQIPVTPQVPPTPAKQYYPDRRKDNTPKWKKWTEIVAVGIAGGLLIANIFVTVGTWKAAHAAKSAAEAAQRQVRDSEAAQSARLVFEDLVVDFTTDPPQAGYTVSNRGNSVALEINLQTGGGNGAPDQANNWRPNFDSIRDTINGINIEPNPRGFSFPVGVGQVFSFSIPSQADISNRRASAYQYAIYVYRDIFGQKHMVSDCFYINLKTMRLEHCPLGQHSE